MDTASGDDLLTLFDQRFELLTEVSELTDRLCRCIEQGKGQRLDRLIDRREHALRRWGDIEQAISVGVASSGGRMLSGAQKAKLRELVAGAEGLVVTIIEGNKRIERAMIERRSVIADEINALRKGRKTLRAYARRDGASSTESGIDRNA